MFPFKDDLPIAVFPYPVVFWRRLNEPIAVFADASGNVASKPYYDKALNHLPQ